MEEQILLLLAVSVICYLLGAFIGRSIMMDEIFDLEIKHKQEMIELIQKQTETLNNVTAHLLNR